MDEIDNIISRDKYNKANIFREKIDKNKRNNEINNNILKIYNTADGNVGFLPNK